MAFRDPVFAITYGQSKVGKTTDNLFSFPNAFYIARPGALKPSENVCGFSIPPENVYYAADLDDAIAKVREVKARKKFKELVVDDLSFLCDATMRKFAASKQDGGWGLDGWKLWGAVYNKVLDFRNECRLAGFHVVLNAHEKESKPPVRGGPRLPGKLPEQLPADCDLVMRATMLAPAEQMGKLGWKGVYRCAPWDTGWISADRHGVAPDYGPMNIGEILRAAGYVVTRPPGLEKMETYVESMSNDLWVSGPTNDKAVAQQYAAFFTAHNTPLLLMRWIIRDALDRVTIRRARANPLALYGIT